MIARLWFSRDGAASGKPWRVQRRGQEPELAASVCMVGRMRTLTCAEGFPGPDGPTAIVELEQGICDVIS